MERDSISIGEERHGHADDHDEGVDYKQPQQNDEAAKTRVSTLSNDYTILFATCLYTILIVFGWVGVCILKYRPFGFPYWLTSANYYKIYGTEVDDRSTGLSGVNQNLPPGPELTAFVISNSNRWKTFIRTDVYICAVLTIPLTSAICARGAVVYMQTNRKLSLRQTLALADRLWFSPSAVRDLVMFLLHKGDLSWFFLASAVLCLLGTIIWPIQGLLVSEESMNVIIHDGITTLPQILTYDADITGLSQGPTSFIVNNVAAALSSATSTDNQPHLWKLPNECVAAWWQKCELLNSTTSSIIWNDVLMKGNETFVSAIANDIDTHMLPSHGFRLNSSVTCSIVSESDYPTDCAVAESFEAVSHAALSDNGTSFDFRACVPGNSSEFPWSMTTRNRQDIVERGYLQINADGLRYLGNHSASTGLTIECIATTTAGYFELPSSDINDATFGPLLDLFNVTKSERAGTDVCNSIDINTAYESYTGGPCLGTETSTAFNNLWNFPILPNVSHTPAVGPLRTSFMALFGPGSWFALRANTSSQAGSSYHSDDPNHGYSLENCEVSNVAPFGHIYSSLGSIELGRWNLSLCTSGSAEYFQNDLASWLASTFFFPKISLPPFTTETLLTISVFFANEATLQQAQGASPWRRAILTLPGQQVQKFKFTLSTEVLLSMLGGLYLLGLWLMALYACSAPSWTKSLDAFAMLRMGAHLREENMTELPLLTRVDINTFKALNEVNGWLGEREDPDATPGVEIDIIPAKRTRLGANPPLRARTGYSVYLDPVRGRTDPNEHSHSWSWTGKLETLKNVWRRDDHERRWQGRSAGPSEGLEMFESRTILLGSRE